MAELCGVFAFRKGIGRSDTSAQALAEGSMNIRTRPSTPSEAHDADALLDLIARGVVRWLAALDDRQDVRVYADANDRKEGPAW